MKVILSLSVLSLMMLAITADPTDVNGMKNLNDLVHKIDSGLISTNARMSLYSITTYTDGANGEGGRVIYQKDIGKDIKNRHLDEWVKNDPRRSWGQEDVLTHYIDTPGIFNHPSQFVDNEEKYYNEIDQARQTWNSVKCGKGSMEVKQAFEPGYWGTDYVGYVQYLVGFGGSPYVVADIMESGLLPGYFFDILLGPGVLGVQFGFIFLDANGEPLPGKALADIYYNDAYNWGYRSGYLFDLQTVALHEQGHGLSMSHFGTISCSKKDIPCSRDTIKATPRAVMNAIYLNEQRSPLKTDRATYCSLFSNWNGNSRSLLATASTSTATTTVVSVVAVTAFIAGIVLSVAIMKFTRRQRVSNNDDAEDIEMA